MKKIKVKFDSDVVIGKINSELYGSFVEHIGRCVYGGIYQKNHATADAFGFRNDVKELIRELGVTAVRYPGGNFVSGYDWKDGIGKDRKMRLDYAWKQAEPNEVGTAEFLRYAQEVGFSPIMCVNLGTAGPKEAAELLEYCNGQVGYYADLRESHGYKPFNVKRWCLGNEMDGDWQIGHKSAEEYGALATETAKLFRAFDPSLKLTVCGSSNTVIPSYPSWDRKVLEKTYDIVDNISVHSYYYSDNSEQFDLKSYLGSFAHFKQNLDTIIATCDVVKAEKRSPKTMMLSVDEWNVWRHYDDEAGKDLWTIGPERLESKYDYSDCIVFASLLTELINHCDRIDSACLAQLVNVIAPILTENEGRTLKQTIFYPFAEAAARMRGTALKVYTDAPSVHCNAYGEYPAIACAAAVNGEKGTLFAVNLSEEDYELSLPFEVEVKSVREIVSKDLDAINTFDCPNKVVLKDVERKNNVVLKAHSVQFIGF